MYIALDIETTGLDPETCQVLEIAMVADVRTRRVRDCPVFRETIKLAGVIRGESFGLMLNSRLLGNISRGRCVSPDHAMGKMQTWLAAYSADKPYTLLGKNVGGFDWQFVKRFKGWPTHLFSHRFLDVGSLYATSTGMFSQSQLLGRIARDYNIPGSAHEALHDARVSLALARSRWGIEA